MTRRLRLVTPQHPRSKGRVGSGHLGLRPVRRLPGPGSPLRRFRAWLHEPTALVIAVAGAGAAGWLLGSPILATAPPVGIGLWRHRASTSARAVARRREAQEAIDVVDALIQQLKGGRSLAEAVRATSTARATGTAAAAGAPLGPVLARLRAALDAGTGLEEALNRAVGWAPVGAAGHEPVALTLSTLLILVQRGGPALPALERLSSTLHASAAVDQEVTAQTSQATASVLALAGMPLLFAAVVTVLDHRIARFYLREPLGAFCLIFAGSSSYLSWWWMQRIIQGRS